MAEAIARRIQHTNVRPDATRGDIHRLLDECIAHGFDGAMVNPIWVPLVADRLAGSAVKACTALDFPMGGAATKDVARAAARARRDGAVEIDVMTKVGWLKSGLAADYLDHLGAVVSAAEGAPVKAMLEAVLLTADELARAVDLCGEAGVSYLKNSSGFDGGRASPEIVRTLARLSGGRMRIKASGGIRTFEQAAALVEAGAHLLGSSGGVAIVSGARTGPKASADREEPVY